MQHLLQRPLLEHLQPKILLPVHAQLKILMSVTILYKNVQYCTKNKKQNETKKKHSVLAEQH